MNPNVDFIAGSLSRAFRIQSPEQGTWKIVVTAGSVVNGNLQVLAFAKHDGVQFSVSVFKDTLTFPEAVQIQGTPRFEGEAVINAAITGMAIRPDGSKVPITLFDDGLPEHADAVSGDGNYANRFDQYRGHGPYPFAPTASVLPGHTFPGEALSSF
ncbi:hypothetical protein, partial [Raoultella ornithinolytica]|uniref:hypothetical protein n=1 Tax=Raoultella ornithinolytica TaxID=54291 RepID=UPI0013C32412